MVVAGAKPTSYKKTEIKENLLTPRFYTTDFKALAELDISSQETELRAMLEEMRNDYNRHHFVRDEEFQKSWEHIDEKTRKAFISFLERSCVSEFSGFLLFKEISRRIKDKNPLLSEMFSLMARDEARHAGFLNKAMADFKISLDLGYLTRHRIYTFFPPEWIIYAVYLSEKIGYWRYILMYRHLEKNPQYQFYPLFKKFENWCQDENRHGDIFNALLRSQTSMWKGWKAKLWSKFFLLSVFATHALTVCERSDFYQAVGLDAKEYDRMVVRKTNKTAAKAFPVILDTSHPEFFPRLEKCADYYLEICRIDESKQPGFIKFLRKLPLQIAIFWNLLRLYLLKGIETEPLRGTVR
ncbi:MAG: magnesium-protoporphyrin IX monomethyl ester (oxidative) cyclase [Geminocystis sp.]|nr:magnesium-protoporphyrin IX monomethyl ester (oxidative) cyclase [Geminocystis sp.]HIK38110.1 magnesium-protoporphyrin IX monomethyl ester (oxidative) cyclase [Geminocystis sp. M7585_C2015_104]MCS7148326.1 magnesium-protoporphyrin IX monomethyl ester (oxidative) cyclase [Geminocystis sp.]MCX8077740.1 magnesium-protoporphyrin IX monomethyl ester (oxidative) cyclase [Geminocystis sp.]MDW8116632.1 magnesium-protoporphyrin IX monomethyl ester (oxidative) cyclase [Geminocystis sp.]